MARPRCCEGTVYVLPTIPVGSAQVWAVCCHACHRVLTQVQGSRQEVFADL